MSCFAGEIAFPFSSMRGISSVSTVLSIAAAVSRIIETPMPNAFIWLNTRNDITTVISALGSVIFPPMQSSIAVSIIATLATCNMPSSSAVYGVRIFVTSTFARRLYSSASRSFLSPFPVRLKDFTTLMPCTVSRTASMSAVCDFCVSSAITADFFSIADTASRYSKIPAREISPILQSKTSITAAKTAVVISPPRMFTSTIGTMFSIVLSTVVQTPESCPRLFELKNPMGTLFSLSAMEIRLSAAMKYPA